MDLKVNKRQKKRISILTIDSNDVKKMSRSELEEIAKLHFALKKYEVKTIKEKFFAVNKLSAYYSVDFLSRKSGITRQGYYLWIKKGKPIYKKYNFVLAEIILEIFNKFKGVYGQPIITILLEKYKNIKVNKWVVYRYMKILKIKSIRKKIKPNYFKSGPIRLPNILKRDFVTSETNKKWVTDITYLPTNNSEVYLSIIRDLFNGEIIDWKLSNHSEANLSFKNLISAWNYTGRPKKLIIHSNQGYVYTSPQWKELCEKMEIIISISRRGNSPDNDTCETWFSSFKNESFLLYKRNSLNFSNIMNIVSNYVYNVSFNWEYEIKNFSRLLLNI
ncbi:MAG: IS3 family transposase [Spiroplasma phoeniceum]|nr:MAG: IS3 family transposase [Spiroplasma phoeniceum]UZQ32393.1 MAG: IS3 family transposase [Spiroplasma phoeniceum]